MCELLVACFACGVRAAEQTPLQEWKHYYNFQLEMRAKREVARSNTKSCAVIICFICLLSS